MNKDKRVFEMMNTVKVSLGTEHGSPQASVGSPDINSVVSLKKVKAHKV